MRKELFFIMLIALFSNAANAMNDTVHYGDPCYLFNPIDPSDCIARLTTFPEGGYTITAYERHSMFLTVYEYILPTETTIYGIATTIFRNEENYVDSSGYIMYLYIIDDDKQLKCIDSVVSYSRATQYMYSAMYEETLIHSVAPCYEYFFKEPHVLSGAIYIGAALDSNYNGAYNPKCAAIDRNFNQHWIELYNVGTPPQFSNGLAAYWGCHFPIIQPERIGCMAAVPEVIDRGEDNAVLSWDMEGDSCQLSIAPYGMPVDSGIVVDLRSNNYTATGLDSGVYYAAKLRTQCHHRCHIHADTVLWSDWGEPTLFYLGSQEPTSSISIHSTVIEPSFILTPNPAHGSVTVQCDEGIKSVELLSVKGETVHRRNAAGAQSCTLDITGLSRGIYIVQITTPQGTAARKLAVE